MKRKKTAKKPPKRLAWFFGYHVFDLEAARRVAGSKPVLILTTVLIEPLLADSEADLDLAKLADTRQDVAILGRVPIGEGRERYLLLDGYEVAKRCHELGRPLRLRCLSREETKLCRLDGESSGEWQ